MSTGDASTSASSAADGSSTSDETRYDMALPDLPQGSACNGKIDLVFAVAQGGGFLKYLDTLYASYPEILATIEDVFDDFDLHVIFINPSSMWGAVACPKNMCPEEGGCPAEDYEDFPCWALYDDDALTKCDSTMGAGIIFPAGRKGSNKPCDLPPGQRFIAGDDPFFGERFSCLSHTGYGAGDEQGWALGEALSWDLRGGCNAGFLRDDALLFVVYVSGRDDSPYNPYVWAQRVLEAKEYAQDMVVLLGIGLDLGLDSESPCEGVPTDKKGTTLWLTEEFEHSVFGSKCAPTYAPFFTEAATMAAELCANGPQS